LAKGLPRSIIKKYGISKKAWAVFRGQGAPKKVKHVVRKKTSRVRRYYGKAKRVGRRAGALGGISLKEIIFGAALMTAGKVVVGMVAPGLPFQRQVGTLAGGAVAAFTGLPGKRLISFGLMDAGSDLIAGFIGGTSGGGYDF
jgi:hypothetical protein